jgi:hypothetical protein
VTGGGGGEDDIWASHPAASRRAETVAERDISFFITSLT